MNAPGDQPIRPPKFWNAESGTTLARVLAPAGAAYAMSVNARNRATRAVVAPVPVICVGNPVLGGGGKTPTAMAIAARLRALELPAPHFLTRGYGGRLKGPVTAGPQHGAIDIGDEALLLAGVAPTHIARHRPAGADLAVRAGAGVIVMDDGYQNPTLHKDLGLLVVDGAAGVGNGRVFPAGPLREPLAGQWARCGALVVVGPGPAGQRLAQTARAAQIPVLGGALVPAASAPHLAGRDVVCFSGIANATKFHASLERAGARICQTMVFGDHHMFSRQDIRQIVGASDRWPDALLLCTQKDHVRLTEANDPGGDLQARVQAFPVEMAFADTAAIDHLLQNLDWL